MRDIIFLRCDHAKVLGMTKSVPQTRRGEIAIKVNVTVDNGAYGPPVIEQNIEVVDWADVIGHDSALVDLALKRPFITAEEAELIKERRLQELAESLRATGRFEVTEVQADEG
jgi:hypothetical protein